MKRIRARGETLSLLHFSSLRSVREKMVQERRFSCERGAGEEKSFLRQKSDAREKKFQEWKFKDKAAERELEKERGKRGRPIKRERGMHE